MSSSVWRKETTIKRFSTLFAGHVELGDVGQDATPVNERRYSNEHLASVFENTEALARVMDALGYDTLPQHP